MILSFNNHYIYLDCLKLHQQYLRLEKCYVEIIIQKYPIIITTRIFYIKNKISKYNEKNKKSITKPLPKILRIQNRRERTGIYNSTNNHFVHPIVKAVKYFTDTSLRRRSVV